jgi:hypothetical protein
MRLQASKQLDQSGSKNAATVYHSLPNNTKNNQDHGCITRCDPDSAAHSPREQKKSPLTTNRALNLGKLATLSLEHPGLTKAIAQKTATGDKQCCTTDREPEAGAKSRRRDLDASLSTVNQRRRRSAINNAVPPKFLVFFVF